MPARSMPTRPGSGDVPSSPLSPGSRPVPSPPPGRRQQHVFSFCLLFFLLLLFCLFDQSLAFNDIAGAGNFCALRLRANNSCLTGLTEASSRPASFTSVTPVSPPPHLMRLQEANYALEICLFSFALSHPSICQHFSSSSLCSSHCGCRGQKIYLGGPADELLRASICLCASEAQIKAAKHLARGSGQSQRLAPCLPTEITSRVSPKSVSVLSL